MSAVALVDAGLERVLEQWGKWHRVGRPEPEGAIVRMKKRECSVTHRTNGVYQLTGHKRSVITKAKAS